MRPRRRNTDEQFRSLERQARSGGDKTPWLNAILRRGGLEAVQFEARSLDPEVLGFYVEALNERRLLDDMEEHFKSEAVDERIKASGALIEANRVVLVKPSGERTVFTSDREAFFVGLVENRRPIAWSGWELKPEWEVNLVSPDSEVERRIARELESSGGVLLIDGPVISISGRVTWPDWRFSGEICEVMALTNYTEMRGRLLQADEVAGYNDSDNSDHWHFDPPRIVRVTPTTAESVARRTDSEWVDPYWDIELPTVPPTHTIKRGPDVFAEESKKQDDTLRSLWIDGPSLRVSSSGERQTAEIDPKSVHFTVIPEPTI